MSTYRSNRIKHNRKAGRRGRAGRGLLGAGIVSQIEKLPLAPAQKLWLVTATFPAGGKRRRVFKYVLMAPTLSAATMRIAQQSPGASTVIPVEMVPDAVVCIGAYTDHEREKK